MSTSRDRTRERPLLAAAARPHGPAGACWALCARGRLEAGQATYGDRWATVGLSRLLELERAKGLFPGAYEAPA